MDLKQERVMPFAALQKRLGRKDPGKKVLEDSPVIFLAFDLLEVEGADWRSHPLHERRAKLADILLAIPGGSRIEDSSQVRAPGGATPAIARSEIRAMGPQ